MRWRKAAAAGTARGAGRPVAVVYRGADATDRMCAEAVAEVLRASRWRFTVDYVGPSDARQLSAASLAGADLYAHPGGGESLERAYRRLRRAKADVREYVGSGGRYLGVCLGGYLAGATPGFDLLPGDTDRYIDLPGASVADARDHVVPVVWRGHERRVFFQDGPHFVLRDDEPAQVLARYTNDAVAALVAPFGAGRVGVCGPHPEATPDWFEDVATGGRTPDGRDLALDLVDALMEPRG